MQQALNTLRELCTSNGYELQDLCFTTLYVRSIAEYPVLNSIYLQSFGFHNPPTRVCVECPLPDDCHVVMEAIAYRAPATHSGDDSEETQTLLNGRRNTMHVQGISHWAPANIGPYSQSTRVRARAKRRERERAGTACSLHVNPLLQRCSYYRCRLATSHTSRAKLRWCQAA